MTITVQNAILTLVWNLPAYNVSVYKHKREFPTLAVEILYLYRMDYLIHFNK